MCQAFYKKMGIPTASLQELTVCWGGGGRLTNLCTRHTQNELRAVGAQQSRESSSLRDLGAASERRPQMIRALKDVRGDKDRACFVREE